MGYSGGTYTRILHTAAASSSFPPPILFSFYDVIFSVFFSHLSPTIIIVFLPKFRRSSHAHAYISQAYDDDNTLQAYTTNCVTYYIMECSSIIWIYTDVTTSDVPMYDRQHRCSTYCCNHTSSYTFTLGILYRRAL